jgi:hypothetical protein
MAREAFSGARNFCDYSLPWVFTILSIQKETYGESVERISRVAQIQDSGSKIQDSGNQVPLRGHPHPWFPSIWGSTWQDIILPYGGNESHGSLRRLGHGAHQKR